MVLVLLGYVLKFHEFKETIGWRLISVVILLACVAWMIYVYWAKKPSMFSGEVPVPEYSKTAKNVSVVCAAVAAVLVGLSLWAERPFQIPTLAVHVINSTGKDDVRIKRRGEFFLTAPMTPLSDQVVASGVILLSDGGESDEILIRAGEDAYLDADFLNDQQFEPLLRAGDKTLRIMLDSAGATNLLTCGDIPFDEETLTDTIAVVEARPPTMEARPPLDIDGTATPPGGYPSVGEIKHLPSRAEVAEPPDVQAERVNFKYKNASGVDLKLILFDCSYHHFPIDDPLAPRTAWRIWDFPAINRFLTFSDFRRGTGWYVFFVERYDNGERYQLGTENVFYSDWPTLTVTSTGDEGCPFEATFSAEE